MRPYYFDVSDGLQSFADTSGINLENFEDVSTEAESLLRLLAFEQLNNPVAKILKAIVRDKHGRIIFRATITAGKGKMLFSGRRVWT